MRTPSFTAIPASCAAAAYSSFSTTATRKDVQCTKCLGGTFLSNGRCLASCPQGTFASGGNAWTCQGERFNLSSPMIVGDSVAFHCDTADTLTSCICSMLLILLHLPRLCRLLHELLHRPTCSQRSLRHHGDLPDWLPSQRERYAMLCLPSRLCLVCRHLRQVHLMQNRPTSTQHSKHVRQDLLCQPVLRLEQRIVQVLRFVLRFVHRSKCRSMLVLPSQFGLEAGKL